MREGYEPSPEELGLAQEIFEANGMSEQDTDHGFRQVDVDGRTILQTETWGETQQTIQFTYGEGETMTEQGKLLTGPEAGKLVTREHPRTSASFEVRVDDPDLGTVGGSVDGKVETLAGTVEAEGTLSERWANLEVTHSAFLNQFSSLPAERRSPGQSGETYVILRGDFGGGFDLNVGGRTITVDSIKKLSITFSPDGQPLRANFGTIAWHEKETK